MRHRINGRQLGRTSNERQALFRSQVYSIFAHGGIKTTEAKAKSVLPIVEKLVAITKKSDIIAQREFAKYIQDRNFVRTIVNELRTAFADQKANFTQIIRLAYRQGDDALIVKLSLSKPVSVKAAVAAKVAAKKAEKETKKEVKKPVKKAAPKKPAKESK